MVRLPVRVLYKGANHGRCGWSIRMNFQFAADDSGTITHCVEAHPLSFAGRKKKTHSVVTDAKRRRTVNRIESDKRRASASVLHRITHRLLGDAEEMDRRIAGQFHVRARTDKTTSNPG